MKRAFFHLRKETLGPQRLSIIQSKMSFKKYTGV